MKARSFPAKVWVGEILGGFGRDVSAVGRLGVKIKLSSFQIAVIVVHNDIGEIPLPKGA
jgi:hypothetical protein